MFCRLVNVSRRRTTVCRLLFFTVIEPGYTWRNDALEDSDVLEVSTPHLDDAVRLVDNYGREGTNTP